MSVMQNSSTATAVNDDDGERTFVMLASSQPNSLTTKLRAETLIIRFFAGVIECSTIGPDGEFERQRFALPAENGIQMYKQILESSFDDSIEIASDNYFGTTMPAYEFFNVKSPSPKLEILIGTKFKCLSTWQDVNRVICNQAFRTIYKELSRKQFDKQGSLIFDDVIPMVYGFERSTRTFK
jgi:hypothetical protein